jgi:uncharacterized RDD family membrane protein YckC
MACLLCGDRCTCSATGNEFAGEHTAVLIDPDSNLSSDLTEQQFASSLEAPIMRAAPQRIAVAQTATATADPAFYRPNAHPDGAWRDEISQRVQAHRARRRRRFDPEASLSLGFEGEPGSEDSATVIAESPMNRIPAMTPAERAPRMYRRIAMQLEQEAESRAVVATAVPDTNIIEFPRPVTEEMFPEELAEPIIESPRILDVPEEPVATAVTAESLPSFATIHLDHDADKEVPDWIRSYRDEFDEAELELPLQVAPMRSRVLAGVIDVALVLTATALFSVIVLSITKYLPQGKAAALTAIVLSAAFWLAYHYAFLVFSGLTPGMQVSQLELCSFEGCYPLRRTRGARAWAMGVSCMSVGMGFAWAVVDEDNLGWHDRITRTYLRQS